MSNKPFFTIVTPTLNEEKYIPHLLSDLKKQHFQDFEVIVVDGNSKDKTTQKINEFQGKLNSLNVYTLEKNNVSKQRNFGASKAKGKYILFIDADSRLPEYFLTGVAYQISVEKPDIFGTWCIAEGETTSGKAISTVLNIFMETAILLENPAGLGGFMGCTDAVFKAINGFDHTIAFAEDTDFINRAYKQGFKYKLLHEPRFIMSMRRFEKNGTLTTLNQYAVIYLKWMLNANIDQEKEYPMGGDIPKNESFKFFKSFQKTIAKGKLSPKILDKIKAMITLEE